MPAREPRCDFQILTAAPSGGFVEIGTVDVNPGAYGSNSYRKIDSFKHEIQPYVCLAGGDAAIAYANGYGMYMKATILKATAGAAQAAPAAARDTTAGGDTGCKYDTQCKGDRICVAGACADPSAPRAAAP